MGLTAEELAAQLRVTPQQIAQWEEGKSYPPFTRAQQLAKALRIPFGYLFLSAPPKLQPPIPDLRSVNDQTRRPSPNFLDLLNDIVVKHDWFVEYAREARLERPDFVGRYNIHTPAAQVVEDIRSVIAPDELLQKAKSWSDYLRLLVERVEDVGIIVMRSGVVRGNPHRPLSVEEFRGFVITDSRAPLIFLNAKDAQAAQIFTIAHELVHIWIGESGISNPDPATLERAEPSRKSSVERFCNEAATELLVPGRNFDDTWRTGQRSASDKAEYAARKFRVSVPVILRRAYERNLIAREQFFLLLQAHQDKVEAIEKKKEEEEESGGNFYNTFFARNSHKLSHAILTTVRGGGLSKLDAARLLNVKTHTIPKLAERALP